MSNLAFVSSARVHAAVHRLQIRTRARRIYRQARLVPLATAAATGALFRPGFPDLSHLTSYNQEGEGAVQPEEAMLLYSMVRVIRAKTIVELGFFRGQSTFNFLRAMDEDAALYSFDIDPYAAAVARTLYAADPRFHFKLKSQTEITQADIDGRGIDLLFIDASHELKLNQQAFDAIGPLLAPRAVVVVHDTGTWSKASIVQSSWATDFAANRPASNWVSDHRFAHQPDEREFVNWINREHSRFSQVHFHSNAVLRHGLTVLQAGGPLSVSPPES